MLEGNRARSQSCKIHVSSYLYSYQLLHIVTDYQFYTSKCTMVSKDKLEEQILEVFHLHNCVFHYRPKCSIGPDLNCTIAPKEKMAFVLISHMLARKRTQITTHYMFISLISNNYTFCVTLSFQNNSQYSSPLKHLNLSHQTKLSMMPNKLISPNKPLSSTKFFLQCVVHD